MERKALHQPFELYVSDLECWNERPLIYHFFEIVQILEGDGVRHVNNNYYPYVQGNIYLFTPLDCRGFDSTVPTRFCSIRFSEVFLSQFRGKQERERITQWLKQLEHIFYHHNRFQEVLIRRPEDCNMIATLIAGMIAEYEGRQLHHEENLQSFVTLILNILARNVSGDSEYIDPVAAGDTEPLINKMLVHIQQHISSPDRLRVDYLAQHFNLSTNYVGEYFRKFTGESLQHYITHYKIRLVQQRLTYSHRTIGEIADELGFTDESHLSRQFKKYSGVSPAAYRKARK
ncbi:helix-turn-helix domain-containing protein [Chitinophaga pendula]|uniref:helix-turn-helix domain-containing protein n=1 Tax=Chitinophaga TaxID=79328 RepID=UPI000BAFCCBD|nr:MULTISPECIES: helix-turn-helix domain-containing protein [Chitinophaga]ASZ13316.1 hypothetical protein CK934_21305 [Chitinophaga sp. MD30]UCJ09059.1 helix-turn-helix domain-containing protein [Chitinophaga pendula]